MKIPIEIQTAFIDQIELAALRWKDGIISHEKFQETIKLLGVNIYKAGWDDAKGRTHNKE